MEEEVKIMIQKKMITQKEDQLVPGGHLAIKMMKIYPLTREGGLMMKIKRMKFITKVQHLKCPRVTIFYLKGSC